ncbi:hypothetical protein BJ878DRAFT_486102 [Calycina marina]|uniref:Uncharacterized protein n=1 Tax=Calycina marina TaxID=1763456 RepID=A0A9P8CJJ5_9HELO|nr:hypothetical protein BJ878DRAFT_486102 [Calycina marina]
MVANESHQIDTIACERGWFHGDKEDECYQTIHMYMNDELSLEVAIEAITKPTDEICSSAWEPSKESSVERNLWKLHYGILHTAKKTPWRDTAAHNKLVDLVRGPKAHPDPHSSEGVAQNFCFSKNIWSNLGMLGPSTRECWNNSPGCGSGYSVPEIHAWTNINAFVARLTETELSPFWIYCIWAMRSGLEDEHKLDSYIPVATVWPSFLGRSCSIDRRT